MTTPASPSSPRVVVVPDGAAEPRPAGRFEPATSLAVALTPNLDALARRQGIGRLRTIAAGRHPGTEAGLPALLGLTLTAPVGRGWLEAAALGVELAPGLAAWRLDTRAGTPDADVLRAAFVHAGLDVRIHDLPEHRQLLIGPHVWGDAAVGHDQQMPARWRVRLAPVEQAAGVRLHAWGRAARPALPRLPGLAVLPGSTAALGIARLVGAEVLSDLDHAVRAIRRRRHTQILVHDGRPDDAGHARDPAAKVAAVTAFDRDVLGPVLAASDAVGAVVVVSPDHGCDPATGAHTAQPVPATWPGAPGRGRVTEADVAPTAVWDAAAVVRRLAGGREAA